MEAIAELNVNLPRIVEVEGGVLQHIVVAAASYLQIIDILGVDLRPEIGGDVGIGDRPAVSQFI